MPPGAHPVNAARRALLRGRPGTRPAVRPPWALPEDAFTERCTRCGACGTACPERIIVAGDGGFPRLDFGIGECTFCSACVQACAPGALEIGGARPSPWTAGVGDACLGHRAVLCQCCRDACPERAIRFALATGAVAPDIDSERCTGCGACVGACPVSAITMRDRAEAGA